MNKQELEHKLTGAKLVLARHEHKKSQIEKNIKQFEAQLAEAEKPKPLEQGDYGIDEGGKSHCDWVHIDDKTIYRTGKASLNPGDWPRFIREKTGNIFKDIDDLKAIAEPLESFEINHIQVKYFKGNCIEIEGIDHEMVDVPIEDFSDFILNLRCIEAFINKEKS